MSVPNISGSNGECLTKKNYQAYDQHLNMVLADVQETTTTVEIDEETDEEIVKVQFTVSMPLRLSDNFKDVQERYGFTFCSRRRCCFSISSASYCLNSWLQVAV